MKPISKIWMAMLLLLPFTACTAQVKNAKTETVKVNGNCEMCKKNIEQAGSLKKIAQVQWDPNTQMATLSYNEKKTNPDEILKRIALAGYDSEKFLAPDEVYAQLPKCCQYERTYKTAAKTTKEEVNQMAGHDHTEHTGTVQEKDPLKAVFDQYFALKDALVSSDGNEAAVSAKKLLEAIQAVKMENLSNEAHMTWMKVKKDLELDAEHISGTKAVDHQRDHFMSLSKNMYPLVKAAQTGTPVYYDFCPMANGGKGAHWLSLESEIKNPYYGAQMLNCGKTVETIK